MSYMLKVKLKNILALSFCLCIILCIYVLTDLLQTKVQHGKNIEIWDDSMAEFTVSNTNTHWTQMQESVTSTDPLKHLHITPSLTKNHHVSEKTPNSQREKYLIYYCTQKVKCCGWGDRQSGVLTVYVLSVLTNRTFGVIMTSPCPITNFFHPQKINWIVNRTALKGLSVKYLHTNTDKIFYELMAKHDFNAVYPQDVVYLSTNRNHFDDLRNNPNYKTIFRDKFGEKSRSAVFADLWQHTFKLNTRVVKRLNALLEKAKPTPHYKLVCAHLRFGKNGSNTWMDPKVRNTMKSISSVWKFFNSSFRDSRKYSIFIASDSQQPRIKAKKLFPLQVVETEGEIIHIDKTNRVTSDLCEGFMKVILEQYLLSKCDVLVLTHSQFGKGAGIMRQTRDNLYYLEGGKIRPKTVYELQDILDIRLNK